MKVPSSVSDCSRLRSRTRRIDLRGVAWGLMGGNRDWKTVVARDSRCLGTFDLASESGREKLFMTS